MLQVVKTFLIPCVKSEVERLQFYLDGSIVNATDRNAADHMKNSLQVTKNSLQVTKNSLQVTKNSLQVT